jgi:hypothetical protein
VEEGEQEHECRIGIWRLGKQGEAGGGDPLPVTFAMDERVLASRSLQDGVHEPLRVRYGDTRARTHADYPRIIFAVNGSSEGRTPTIDAGRFLCTETILRPRRLCHDPCPQLVDPFQFRRVVLGTRNFGYLVCTVPWRVWRQT